MAEQLHDQLARIASGDQEAFARFYDEWFAFVLAQARRASRHDEHASADLVQEVMLKFIRKTPLLDSPAALGAWLKRATVSTACDRAESESRRRRREQARGERPGDPSLDEDHAERLAWLRRELELIDAEAGAILAQRFALGRTLAQIGLAFGLSPSAVDGRIGRTLRALHKRKEGSPHEP